MREEFFAQITILESEVVTICGIGGIHVLNTQRAPSHIKMEYALDKLALSLNHRGGDATGYVAITNDGHSAWQKASCDAHTFCRDRRSLPGNVRSLLVHTRLATQGHQAFPENNHPVRRGSVYVIHNGHVFNDGEIFKKANRERFGQVDSEAIAALIAKYGIMKAHKAMEEISGAAAIAAVDETRPGIMVLARSSSSPLMFYENGNIAVFASTHDCVREIWKILYGTPPAWNSIKDIREGVALYLGKEVEKVEFLPDDTFWYHGKRYEKSMYSWDTWGSTKTIETSKALPVGSTKEDEKISAYDDFNCELCGHPIIGDEIEVFDGDDTWILCEDCVTSLWGTISANDIKRIHDDEDSDSIHNIPHHVHVTI